MLCLCGNEKPIPGSLPLVTGLTVWRRGDGSGHWGMAWVPLTSQTQTPDNDQRQRTILERGRGPPATIIHYHHHHDRRQWPHATEQGTLNTAQTHSLPNQNQNLIFIHSCLCSFIDYKHNRSSSTKYGFDWMHLISYTIKSKPKLSNVCSMNILVYTCLQIFMWLTPHWLKITLIGLLSWISPDWYVQRSLCAGSGPGCGPLLACGLCLEGDLSDSSTDSFLPLTLTTPTKNTLTESYKSKSPK